MNATSGPIRDTEPVALSDCDLCADSAASYAATGIAVVCVCGRVYAADDFRWPVPPSERVERPHEPPTASARAHLGAVLGDLAMVERYRRDRMAGSVLRAPPSILARLQGTVKPSTSDRSADSLWRMVQDPQGRVGRAARADFVSQLVEHCEETSRPDDAIDYDGARALAERMATGRLPPLCVKVLRTLQREASPSTPWETAARIIGEEYAPKEVRQAWNLTVRSTGPGRPRRDVTRPPPEAERVAYGEGLLAWAIGCWMGDAVEMPGWCRESEVA